MKKVIFLIIAFTATALFYSCTKENIIEDYQIGIEQTTTDIGLRGPERPRRSERACQTDGVSGIECIPVYGGSCKKLKPCTAVGESALRVANFFTPTELENWSNLEFTKNRAFMLHMWEIGWFYHPDDLERWNNDN